MGKKKAQTSNHVQQSMGQMVSKAALAQMAPQIEHYVQQSMRQLGSQLAMQQASTLETLFARVVVLEELLMEKHQLTADELTERVSDIEDRKEGLIKVSTVSENDVVRVEVSTKSKDQADFQGSSRLKVYQTGCGQTMGPELESALLGMATGEVKDVPFGENQEMVARLKVNRISRLSKTEEVSSENTTQG